MQCGTRSRPTGWLEAPFQIEVPGHPPVAAPEVKSYSRARWQIERAVLEVAIKNPALVTATVFDMNGMPIGEVPRSVRRAKCRFRFRTAAMYVVVGQP